MKFSSKNNSIEIISVFNEVSYFEQVAFAVTEPYANAAEYFYEIERIGKNQAVENVKTAETLIHERMKNPHLNMTTKIVKGSPGREIVEEAERWDADLIIMGSHGYGFWKRAYLGSTSDKVIHYAPCSVLIIRK